MGAVGGPCVFFEAQSSHEEEEEEQRSASSAANAKASLAAVSLFFWTLSLTEKKNNVCSGKHGGSV